MPNARSRLKTASLLACVVLAAGGGLLLVRHHHRAPAPGPHPVASATPTLPPASVTPTAAVSPTVSLPVRSPSPTPSRSAATAPTPSASPTSPLFHGVTLIDGPYGFQVPQGWTATPLVSTSPTSQAAHWTDPASPARIDYLIVTSTAVYSIDHTVNLGAIEAALPCQHLPPTSFTYVPGKGPRYTCAPQGGLNVGGMVLVKPYPQGFRLLQVSMPAAQDAVAAQILAGFH